MKSTHAHKRKEEAAFEKRRLEAQALRKRKWRAKRTEEQRVKERLRRNEAYANQPEEQRVRKLALQREAYANQPEEQRLRKLALQREAYANQPEEQRLRKVSLQREARANQPEEQRLRKLALRREARANQPEEQRLRKLALRREAYANRPDDVRAQHNADRRVLRAALSEELMAVVRRKDRERKHRERIRLIEKKFPGLPAVSADEASQSPEEFSLSSSSYDDGSDSALASYDHDSVISLCYYDSSDLESDDESLEELPGHHWGTDTVDSADFGSHCDGSCSSDTDASAREWSEDDSTDCSEPEDEEDDDMLVSGDEDEEEEDYYNSVAHSKAGVRNISSMEVKACEMSCDNCKRTELPATLPRYRLDLEEVQSASLSRRLMICKRLAKFSGDDTCVLCRQCSKYLLRLDKGVPSAEKRASTSWANTWPTFFRDMLIGCESVGNRQPFYTHYETGHLWRFVPPSLRAYWLPWMKTYVDSEGKKPYSECTLESPPPFFVDRTNELKTFTDHINSYDLGRWNKAMCAEGDMQMMLPNVLCPWGCSEFCHQAAQCNLALLIQHHLTRVQLNFPEAAWYKQLHLFESSRLDYIRPNMKYGSVLMNPAWLIRPSVYVDENGVVWAHLCRHHASSKSRKYLYFHVPKKPGHILSPERADQLSHAVLKPQTFRSMRPRAYCTTWRMHRMNTSFAGIDNARVGTSGDFSTTNRVMLSESEAMSMKCRGDIRALAERHVENGTMAPALAKSLIEKGDELTSDRRKEATHGSTYITMEDNLELQRLTSENGKIQIYKEEGELIVSNRTWAPRIMYMKTEDTTGYGYRMKAICPYKQVRRPEPGKCQRPYMMTWSLCGVLMACPELWKAVDCRPIPFRYDFWDGYFLAHLTTRYLFHIEVKTPRSYTPFVGRSVNATAKLMDKLEGNLPRGMLKDNGIHEKNDAQYYKFNTDCWRKLFPAPAYPGVGVYRPTGSSIVPHQSFTVSDKDVIIGISTKDDRNGPVLPLSGDCDLDIDGHKFELRVILCTFTNKERKSSSDFEGRRYMRVGDGHRNWRRQLRTRGNDAKAVVTDMVPERNPFVEMKDQNYSKSLFACVVVYVRSGGQKNDLSKARIDFHRQIGGQGHAVCTCCNYPLIATGRYKKEDKRICMQDGCKNLESYICKETICPTRMCKSCLNSLPLGEITELDPEGVELGINLDARCRGSQRSVANDDVVQARLSEDEAMTIDGEGSRDDQSMASVLSFGNDGMDIGSWRSLNAEDENGRERTGGSEVAERLESGNYLVSCGMDDDRCCEFDEDLPTANRATHCIPCTNAGEVRQDVTASRRTLELGRVPTHVLFNQAGNLCFRKDQKLSGTLAQQNFVQRIVATITGDCFPLLYLFGMMLPRHFYSSANLHPSAILGVPPLCCYSSRSHTHGIASNNQHSRLMMTNGDSSTSTDSHLAFLNHDVQCNAAMSEHDSRQIHRNGFVVDPMNKHGISVRQGTTEFEQGVDSHQAAMNLAGTQPYLDFDCFLTFTCNQSLFPGIKHLHKWKNDKIWAKQIDGYYDLHPEERREYDRAFEQAYGGVVGRCWFEVRRTWLEYLTHGNSVAGKKPQNVFWRDEYQESAGNLPHIHGLIGMRKEDMDDPAFKEKVLDLQRNSVLDLIPACEVQPMIEQGLLKDIEDWHTVKEHAERFLTHTCNARCKIRKGDGEGSENFKCKKSDANRDSVDHNAHEFIHLKYVYSDEFKELMKGMDLYGEPPEVGTGVGEFFHKMLTPTKHIGKIHRGNTDNLSPAVADWFAVLRSMMNYQILTGTNGAARYVVKYVTKLDQGNRCTVWADAHDGTTLKVDNQFLHNTKIVTSKINEDKALEKSREKDKPEGRAVGLIEVSQTTHGVPEVMTNMVFTDICSKPPEERPKCTVKLDSKGNVRRPDRMRTVQDRQRLAAPVDSARKALLEEDRQITRHQKLLYRGDVTQTTAYDKVAQFGMRPVELLQLFANVGEYFRWFTIGKKPLKKEEIEDLLDTDVTKCGWITSLGQRVLLRRRAYAEVLVRFHKRFESTECHLKDHSANLLGHLRNMISEDRCDELFVHDDRNELKDMPIPIFSCMRPHNSVSFLIHLIIVCGEFETELDLKQCKDMRGYLIAAKIIDEETSAKDAVKTLVRDCCMDNVFKRIALSLRKMEDFLFTSEQLFRHVMEGEGLPSTGLPPCILTEILDAKEKELELFWKASIEKHTAAIYNCLPEDMPIPTRREVLRCSRHSHAKWEHGCPIDSYKQSPGQCDESYREQMHAIGTGVRALKKYATEFGRATETVTKGLVIHGVPGAGKSHVISFLSLVGLSMGLRLMTTALLGIRANAFGGIHLHKLLCLTVKKRINPGRTAQLCLASLKRKSNLHLKHCLLTVDVLVIDEFGMLSAEQLTVLDVLLRRLRKNTLPFGGVLILGTMDHMQFSAIEGDPILTSHFFLSDFNLVELKKSVRARSDKNLQEIQNITRMNPNVLLGDAEIKPRFQRLMLDSVTFVKNWNNDLIDTSVVRMFARKKQVQESSLNVFEQRRKEFDRNNVRYETCEAQDRCVLEKTRQQYSFVDDLPKSLQERLKSEMNRRLREPSRILLYEGAEFTSTVNFTGTTREVGYNQSQYLYLRDVPTKEELSGWKPIKLWACANASAIIADICASGIPDRATLERNGWREVSVRCTPDHNRTTIEGYQCLRKQYSLAPVGSSTVNKQTGCTIRGRSAIEVTEECAPFEQAAVVVGLSRNERAEDIIIVCGPNVKGNSPGEPSEKDKIRAINRLWKAMTKKSQWTDFVEEILSRLSTNGTSNAGEQHVQRAITYESHPYQTCNISVPSSSSGYVYLLVSLRDMEEIYVGETECLSRRLREHNTGCGSKGTASPELRPWCLAGYICGLGHMHKKAYMRKALERDWKRYNHHERCRGNGDLMTMIANGQRVASRYNDGQVNEDTHIQYVQTLEETGNSA